MYSENLKKIRRELHLSVTDFAKKVGIPARTIGGWERKERTCSIELVTRLCMQLNVNANWFVTGKGNMFNPPKFEQVEDELTLKVEEILKRKGII